ncbi:hypothetical protein Lfu02_06280 [Longispora fulva]|uniref:Uncharacterized protein n=1 Tax=Longispora fulva TaxID=619741 RepID=A0A8J7GBM0_9ACTN|nr:hypothetical protein [Longispora fulva]MBG6135504.1 hypothetical protein [Longispora fulva]GIG56256.1 hypothetical protein Lfu02_06280 [Longispora fulva]
MAAYFDLEPDGVAEGGRIRVPVLDPDPGELDDADEFTDRRWLPDDGTDDTEDVGRPGQ